VPVLASSRFGRSCVDGVVGGCSNICESFGCEVCVVVVVLACDEDEWLFETFTALASLGSFLLDLSLLPVECLSEVLDEEECDFSFLSALLTFDESVEVFFSDILNQY
jgi:hypothetical protein